MGISASKRVRNTLTNSPHFNPTCNSTFDHFLSISGGSHILPYQLFDAATHLHVSFLHSLALIARWAPSSPTRAQVDHAYRAQAQHVQVWAQAQEGLAQVQKAHVQAQEIPALESLAQVQEAQVQAQGAQARAHEARVQAQEAQSRAHDCLTQAQEAQNQESLAEEGLDQAQEGLGQDQTPERLGQDQTPEGLGQDQAQESLNQDHAQEGLTQESLAQEGLNQLQAEESLDQPQAQEVLAQDQKGVAQAQKGVAQAQEGLGRNEFKEFAVVLFSEMIVSGAKAKVVGMVPIGVVGIGGVGLVSRMDKNLVASAIGVYALSVATWIYVGLG